MKFTATPLFGAFIVDAEPRGDHRGCFTRVFCAREFAARGLATDFVQTNVSRSAQAGTLRGLHFQRGADAEDKLVRASRGRVLDVIVDLRADSPSYRQHLKVELSADNWRLLYVPKGCAHGFLTLEDDCEISYQVSAFYAPGNEAGVRWDDPAFGIDWPLGGALPATPILSAKDAAHPDWIEGARP